MRRAQSVTRVDLEKVEIDTLHDNIIKINPLADWSDQQVDDYIKNNNVPYNQLFNEGFTSIGCEPCTRPIKGDDPRSGRWWWENPDQRECGLHHSFDKK